MIHDTHFFTHFVGNPASSGNGDHKPGLLRRIVRTMVESRQRQADREIAAFLPDQAAASRMIWSVG